MSLASHEVIQFIALATGLLGRPDLGEQRYHFNLAEMLSIEPRCQPGCLFRQRVATGESMFPRSVMTGVHPKAAEIRLQFAKAAQPPAKEKSGWFDWFCGVLKHSFYERTPRKN